ncbi:putative mitochondrial AAA ATPase [Zalerion maritima]|uniref:Mitochondrial AAA ATPase n=1 Tax=Zalerion maritima TaxID=339359 RepID=A0AAD5WR49_9PEZI|nr:putative mitochondrial AAA ATPase [Zalerion maritima]
MQFSDLYKSPKSPLSRLRHQAPQALSTSSGDWDPDLFSRDKDKQKTAVKRHLEEKVRSNWEFPWPPTSKPTSQNTPVKNWPVKEDVNDEGSNATRDQTDGQIWEGRQNNGENDDVSRGLAAGDGDAQQEQPTADVVAQPEGTQAGNGSPDMHGAEDKDTTTIPFTTYPALPSANGHQASHDASDSESRVPGYETDSDAESDYSTVSEDPARYWSRVEWESGEETGDDEINYASSPIRLRSPYRFDNPDSVGTDIVARTLQKKAEKRRELRKEMKWNRGLACFQARRDAWTGAKTVRLKPLAQPQSPMEEKPLSPLSPRRLFMRTGVSNPSSPVGGSGGIVPLSLHTSQSSGDSAEGEAAFSVRETTSKDTNASSTDENEAAAALEAKSEARKRYPVVTLLPKPRPLLPPENPMRASITPGTYNSIFERIVLQGMTPGCPVNLSDMVSACVAGWKRRGEWPPRLAGPEPNFARRRSITLKHSTGVLSLGMVPMIEPPSTRRNVGTQVATTPTAPVIQPPSTTPLPPSSPPLPPKSEARRKSFSFLTREKSKDKDREATKDDDGAGSGKAFRRSLQRVLGWHPHHIRSGSMDGPASPSSGKTDPVPAVLNPETVQGRGSQDGRACAAGSQDQRLSGERPDAVHAAAVAAASGGG